jgi:hypothetical protein
LTQVFGPGWQDLRYESADPAAVFNATNSFIFLEGGDVCAFPMWTFLANNSSALSNWVAAGGSLYVRAAPSFATNATIDLGFGVTLNVGDASAGVAAANPCHPVFAGPWLPVGTAFTGNSFGLATVSGAGLLPILTNASDGNFVVAEEDCGAGHLLFSGSCPLSYLAPPLQASNLLANLLSYAGMSPNPNSGGPPLITLVALLPNGNLQMTFTGQPNNECRVLESTNLVDWQTVATLTNLTGAAQFTDPSISNVPYRFYRVVTP